MTKKKKRISEITTINLQTYQNKKLSLLQNVGKKRKRKIPRGYIPPEWISYSDSDSDSDDDYENEQPKKHDKKDRHRDEEPEIVRLK